MELIPRSRVELGDEAVLVSDWLGLDEQRELVVACREWGRGMRRTSMPKGGVMSVLSVGLGWRWVPYRYTRVGVDGGEVPAFPDWLGVLGRRAVRDAYRDPGVDYRPDIALINYYPPGARMGQHQDRDERALEPVVSISLGDSAVFRFGNVENRGRPYRDVELRSGDLVVFGGATRLAYHGIPRVLAGTGDPAIGLAQGRLNITLRVSGLD